MTYANRDTVCQKGKFKLEEWEDVNYCEHCFYNGDEPLEDEEVVLLLGKLTTENEQLKQKINELQGKASSWKITASEQIMEQSKLVKENEQLKSENNMLKHTIGRNEAYIERITHKGEWSNTSDEEKEVIAYLQAYHQGNVKEIRK